MITPTRHYIENANLQKKLVLITEAGTVSALFDESSYYYSDMLPSKVAKLLRISINSDSVPDRYKMALLDAIDARANDFDRDFVLFRAASYEKDASELNKRAATLRAMICA